MCNRENQLFSDTTDSYISLEYNHHWNPLDCENTESYIEGTILSFVFTKMVQPQVCPK